MEPLFRSIEMTAAATTRLVGTKITYQGLENIPERGGAVVAINHTSYIDFLPAGLATRRRRRRIRYMLKAEMQNVRVVNFLIKRARAIPVNRQSGAEAYAEAVAKLRAGELVGVYPEATISRSFELKEFKSGAARMALEAGVPIIPMIIWGVHRMWTKDHPRALGRKNFPVTVRVCPAVPPAGTVAEVNSALREEMKRNLHEVQEQYPHPAGAYWVPRRLGGSAPTPEEARRLDAAERVQRAQRAGGRC
ncbi:lysophospholipid acyltransferase family protein [Mycolicibacterium sp.]|uniref:lysophospholipid acyltransferase family protein n=1 Tax=Mycolicibacterium sp. TaxID=2320850 RepID=UPI0025E18E17|nr:lysophospholipid acyltransferase family protein [Mycolicibacterium sp.]MCB9411199.1 1-acyl-sn-glycerol-3-phosphate acyltransferase [Mycolicibacterium sp.]